MGFEALCLNALRLLASRDRRRGVPLGEDVLAAIGRVGHAAVHDKHFGADGVDQLIAVRDWLREDASEAIGRAGYAAVHGTRFGTDGVAHLIAVRDLLDAEPEERRTPAYHLAYSHVVGAEREVAELRKAVELDPGDWQVSLWLAGALRRAGRFDEAKEVYRHVMANDDGRPRDGMSESYGETAERHLRELEEGQARLNGVER